MIAQKFTESIADVMRYIVNAEMGGLIDPEHHLYPTYLDLRDMLEQVKSENEALDLQSHAILDRPDVKNPDTEMEFALWDCIDHGDEKKEDLI